MSALDDRLLPVFTRQHWLVSLSENTQWIAGPITAHTSAVKPSRPDLRTNLVIHSNRRSYHLELTSTEETWMAAVSWSYPLDQLTVTEEGLPPTVPQ